MRYDFGEAEGGKQNWQGRGVVKENICGNSQFFLFFFEWGVDPSFFLWEVGGGKKGGG